ncbi:MAG TPA: ribosome assembly factor SBDS [archaeon]|nr:ribosome assembly factor SBDS [archaeon]
MSDKYTTARIDIGEEHFEIMVKPQAALDYKLGKTLGMSQILIIDTIFTDASKGMKASEESLVKAFKTTNPVQIAEIIMKRGEVQVTTDQRRQLVEDKKKQIIAFISRHCIDPRTGLPHPPLRVEQAISQIRISIDPFKSADEQAREVIQALRPILPIKIEQIRIAVKIPPEFASRSYGAVKDFGTITREEWQADGSWTAVVEMPAGLHASFLERLGKISQGTMQTKILK